MAPLANVGHMLMQCLCYTAAVDVAVLPLMAAFAALNAVAPVALHLPLMLPAAQHFSCQNQSEAVLIAVHGFTSSQLSRFSDPQQ